MLRSRHASFWVATAGVGLSLLYGAQVSEPVSSLASLVVGLGAVVAQIVGIRVHRPPFVAPWLFVLGTSVTFLIGVMVRPWATRQEGLLSVSADVFTVTGYILLAIALVLFLPRRGLVRHAVTDGMIVCIGAGTVAIQFLALPAARIGNRPELISVLAALYPLWDVAILLMLLNLGFTAAATLPSFRYLAAAMVSLLVGDIGYAWIGAQGRLTGSPLLDLPLLLGFAMIAAYALHPSMVRLGDGEARPVQSWSIRRLALIVPALAAPAVTLLISRRDGVIVPAVASLGLIGALLVRATSAVRSFAESQKGLKYQATHDALTDLPNRIEISDRITDLVQAEGRRGTGTWVLFLDLDGFKLVNDHWGHEVGDLLLSEVARRLSRLVGPGTVARMSGDEFVIAGTGSLSEAAAVADAISEDLSRPVDIPGIELIVTGSIGIAVRADQLTAEALLRDADLAMYRAKAEGRNRWRAFDAAMRQTVRDRVEIEMALRHALDRSQLWVSYQPIVDCRDGRVTGAEALLRWSHPIRGPITPVEFIPVAEETGMIEEIGAFVLRRSLQQLAVWRDDGVLPADFRLSVNVSARQLRDTSLQVMIGEALAETGFGGERLNLELTESIMMSDVPMMSEVLGGLRSLGIGLSVDDFGTGYSSLSYLSRFPVTAVKIDRSFVQGLGEDAGDEAIARSVVAMASALELAVIAEGVETEAQRICLAELDVVLAQGWLWGAAVAADVFARDHLVVDAPRARAVNW